MDDFDNELIEVTAFGDTTRSFMKFPRRRKRDADRDAATSDYERAQAYPSYTDQGALARAAASAGTSVDSLRRALEVLNNGLVSPSPLEQVESDGNLIVAWRVYTASVDKNWQVILSGMNNTQWPEAELEAVCGTALGGVDEHLKKAVCACGIYSLKQDQRAGIYPDLKLHSHSFVVSGLSPVAGTYAGPYTAMGPSAKVWALCSLWGTVLESTEGYRSSGATIMELWLADGSPERLIAGLRERYDVPVRLLGELNEQPQMP